MRSNVSRRSSSSAETRFVACVVAFMPVSCLLFQTSRTSFRRLGRGGLALERPLALQQLLAEGVEIEVGLPRLRKDFVFLFLHVVADVLGEDRDGGVVKLVAGLHLFEVLDQALDRRVLDLRFVELVL